MIGTSHEEYVFIRFFVFFFRYTPLLYAAALGFLLLQNGQQSWHRIAILIVSALLAGEAIFYVTVWQSFQTRLTEKAVHPVPLKESEREELFHRCLENVSSLELYLRGWFLGADLDDIGRENIKEFLLWAFFEQEEADSSLEDELEDYIGRIEEKLGREIRPGRGSAKSLRLTFDNIHTTYRSLAWYMVVFLVDMVTHITLSSQGFQYFSSSKANHRVFPPRPQTLLAARKSSAPSLSYWYTPHRGDEDTVPILFFHGIGVGLWTYVRFLSDLKTATSKQNRSRVGVIAIELLPVSFRLTTPPLGKAEFLSEIMTILDHHKWDKFAVAAHSYGSVQASHLIHSPQLQSRIESVALIDPVTVLLHLPAVAFNFTRRVPNGANEWQLWYFASTDPGVAHCLGRHFFWRENIIWKDELLGRSRIGGVEGKKRRATVVLSGRDLIVDVASVATYLQTQRLEASATPNAGDAVKVTLFSDFDHAQVFDDPATSGQVANLVRSCCDI